MQRLERNWILYDVANSAFSLIILTTWMPIYFEAYGCQGDKSAFNGWGIANAVASAILVVVAPLLGAFADRAGRKIFCFRLCLGLGLIATLGLMLPQAGAWGWLLLLYVIAVVGFSSGNVFYDALLIDVAPPERRDRLSSLGFGWGYIGSVVPFLLAGAWVMCHAEEQRTSAIAGCFLITAVWWCLFAMPLLFFSPSLVGSSAPNESKGVRLIDNVRDTLTQLQTTLKDCVSNRTILFFLLAYFFYIDGVDTVIRMAVMYGTVIGLKQIHLFYLVLYIQVIAFPCALGWGMLSRYISSTKLIRIAILIYGVIALLAAGVQLWDLSDHQRLLVFILVATLVGATQGGIQALSRSLFSCLIPADKASAYFGLYNIFGRFAAIIGPILMSLTSYLTGGPEFGMLALLPLFILGYLFFIQMERHQLRGSRVMVS